MLGISPFLFHVFCYSICTLSVPSPFWSRLDDVLLLLRGWRSISAGCLQLQLVYNSSCISPISVLLLAAASCVVRCLKYHMRVGR